MNILMNYPYCLDVWAKTASISIFFGVNGGEKLEILCISRELYRRVRRTIGYARVN